MVEHVLLNQISLKMNKDENMRAMIHMTCELAAPRKNMLPLHKIYLLANCTFETCALEAILVTGPSLDDW